MDEGRKRWRVGNSRDTASVEGFEAGVKGVLFM